jgi:hypothetical protein
MMNHRMKAGIFAALLVLPGAATWALSALAQEDVQKAKNDFSAGAAAYDKGLYDIALQAFNQAYSEAKRPAILFSVAQTERRIYTMGHDVNVLRSAVGHYHEYLAEVPEGGRRDDAVSALQDLEPDLARLQPQATQPTMVPGPDGGMIAVPAPPSTTTPPKPKTTIAYRSDTPGAMVSIDGAKPSAGMQVLDNPSPGPHRVHVSADGYVDFDMTMQAVPDQFFAQGKDLTEKPGLLAVETADGADITIDGRQVATTPLASPVEVAPGTHYMVVTKNGRKAASRTVTLVHGQRTEVAVPLETSGQRVAADVLLLVGGATLLAGGAFTAVAFVEQSKAQKILDEKSVGNIQSGDIGTYDDAVSARDMWKTASLVTYGAGLAVLATGAVLFFADKPSPSSAPPGADTGPKPGTPAPPAPKHPDMELGAAPILGPGLWGVSAVGRF